MKIAGDMDNASAVAEDEPFICSPGDIFYPKDDVTVFYFITWCDPSLNRARALVLLKDKIWRAINTHAHFDNHHYTKIA